MPSIASRFRSHRRQSLRLAAQLRGQGITVRGSEMGHGPWIQPQTEPVQDMGRWLQSFYAQTEPLPQQFKAERDDAPPQERDWT